MSQVLGIAFVSIFFLFLFLVDVLATPPPRSRREMERRRDSRLAAQRLANGIDSMAMPLTQSAIDFRMPSEVVRPLRHAPSPDRSDETSNFLALGKEASNGRPRRAMAKHAGKPMDTEEEVTSSSGMSSSTSSTGLGSPSSPSSSSSDTSMPSFRRKQHSKPPIKSREPPIKQQTMSSIVSAMPKAIFNPHDRFPLAKQRKDYFDKVWKEQDLGVHMPAKDLADSIKMMSAAGLDSHTAKVYATVKLKDAPTQAYRDAYADRSKQWASAVGNARRALLEQEDDFASLDQRTQLMKIYHRARKTIEHNRLHLSQARIKAGLATKEPLYGWKKKRMEQRNALVEEVGVAFRNHLAKNKMNFDAMTPEQLERQTRELGYLNVHPSTYQKYIVDYIGKHRSEDEVRRYREERIKHNNGRSNKKRNRRISS